MACLGVVLGLIGLDSINAQPRLTFGRMELIDGIGLVPVVMGLFGVAEVLFNIERSLKREIVVAKITQHAAEQATTGRRARRRSAAARSSASSSASLPGGGAVIASFASYAIEKRLSSNAGALRQGRDRGRRRSRSRQQRGGRRRLHSADDARHPAERGDGAPARRVHHPRAAAGSADDRRRTRSCSGASSPACTSATSCCWCSTCR